ncbi:MAG: hypothetical protein JWR80_5359 [Bradyrhizobium sp.]|nr:hypothetical protein [Bradyrhizobium sp.]
MKYRTRGSVVTDAGLPRGMNGHLAPGLHVLTKPFNVDALATRQRELEIVADLVQPYRAVMSVANDRAA